MSKKSAILAILTLLIIAVAAWIYFKPVTATVSDELLQKVSEANASLENEWFPAKTGSSGVTVIGYDNAIPLFQELKKELPEQRLPIRNFAICAYLHFQYLAQQSDIDPEKISEAATTLDGAIEDLKKREPNIGLPYWLTAKVLTEQYLKTYDEETFNRAVENVKKATELEPDQAPFWYLLFDLYRLEVDRSGEISAIQEKQKAIKKLRDLVPDNVMVLAEAIDAAVELKDKSVLKDLDTLAQYEKTYRLPTTDIEAESSLTKLIPRAIEAIKNDQWEEAAGVVPGVKSGFTRAELYLFIPDVEKVSGHPLNFMLQELDDVKKASSKEVKAPAELKFVESESSAKPFANAIDVVISDFNIDQKLDWIVLYADRVVVYSNSDDQLVELVSYPLSTSYDHLIVCDFDTDDTERRNGVVSAMDDSATLANYFEADQDIILYGSAGLIALENRIDTTGDKRILEEYAASPEVGQIKEITGAVPLDVDFDADLDLLVSGSFGTKLIVNSASRLRISEVAKLRESLGDKIPWHIYPVDSFAIDSDKAVNQTNMIAVDWDRDIDIDVLAIEGDSIILWENFQHRLFRKSKIELTSATGTLTGFAVNEFDGIVSWDLATSTSAGLNLAFSKTGANHVLSRTGEVAELVEGRKGILAEDVDNDSNVDLISWTDSSIFVTQNPQESPSRKSTEIVSGLSEIKNVRAGDFDGDGDIDLCFVVKGGAKLLLNNSQIAGDWYVVSTFGKADNKGRANREGIGGTVEVVSNGKYMARFVTTQRTHFGLGEGTARPNVRIIWPNGMPQNVIGNDRRQVVKVPIYLKGSCPFIYIWDGEKYAFFSDCLWAAPIGLQVAEGKLAPCREWEYLLINGDQFKPKDGKYSIQLTEELWEAAYFDYAELIAVDHPADTEIYTNEKVGPPSVTAHKIFQIRDKKYPQAATDSQGRDVLNLISKRDDQYWRGFKSQVLQGLVDEHFIELDFGSLPNDDRLTLFLTGWIHPTDTSINVGLSQNPVLDGPKFPEIWLADAAGNWTKLDRPMGFPGGKTKTMAVDLSGAIGELPCKLRIVTSAEIYWDEIFVSADLGSSELKQKTVNVAKADLHYRGFSQRLKSNENAPETFDYGVVSQNPAWPPMRGKFTRYGDVRELLQSEDDCSAILASGDELTIDFEAISEPVPQGWRRDFILHVVGYDKDADLNTICGQTVEPLPFRGMKNYPYSPTQEFPNETKHVDYLRKYQTRESSFSRFWSPNANGLQ